MPIFNNLSVNEMPQTYIPLQITNGVLTRPNRPYTYTVPSSAIIVGGELYDAPSAGLQNAFNYSTTYGDYGIVAIDFNKVKIIKNMAAESCCRACVNLASITANELAVVDYASLRYAFYYTAVTSVSFPKLCVFYGDACLSYAFWACSQLTDLYFPAINNTSFVKAGSGIFSSMCRNDTNITLHFPSNVQSIIEGISGYSTTAPFGATSGTCLFDLPATPVYAVSVLNDYYARNPEFDTTTALAWYADGNVCYTSGTTDPAVGDTIYSDSACTTAVTTISSIA